MRDERSIGRQRTTLTVPLGEEDAPNVFSR
jgi:hypothetical protein